MLTGLRELIRQPSRFAPVGFALTLLVVLLSVLGGFLDGLELSQTGPYRAHDDRVIVFTEDSENLIQRSQIAADDRAAVEALSDVVEVGALNLIGSTANAPGGEIQDIVFFGYDVGTAVIPAPSADGAVVDKALADAIDLAAGDTLLIGANAAEVTVGTIVDNLSQGAPTVWVPNDQWREILVDGNPGALLPEGVNQALILAPDQSLTIPLDATHVEVLAERISEFDGLNGLTATQAVESLPVVQQQSSTFQGIIGMTFIVTLLVVALFFALITLERIGLYAVLKALGAGTKDLMAGLTAQAVTVSVIALAAGFALSVGFVAILPAELPVRLVPARLGQTAVGVIVTALLGSLFSLRRVLRIDPAEAIG